MAAPSLTLTHRGTLKGHNGWVTSIACPISPNRQDELVTSSRDKSIIKWQLTPTDPNAAGYAMKRLTGHNHFVEQVVVSSDGQFALSCSWDKTLRLWDLNTGKVSQQFVGHNSDVMSVAFSQDHRQIVSGSRDKTIKLWNTRGECKYTISDNNHTEWVSSVSFSPSDNQPLIVSGGHDGKVKVWNLSNCSLLHNLVGHTGYINTTAVSPDGSLCASGGKDGTIMLWDVIDGKHLYSLDMDSPEIIYSLCFSPNRYWLVAASQDAVRIWDLETKSIIDELRAEDLEPVGPKSLPHHCISVCWSADGNTLYTGYTDNHIRIWHVGRTQ